MDFNPDLSNNKDEESINLPKKIETSLNTIDFVKDFVII